MFGATSAVVDVATASFWTSTVRARLVEGAARPRLHMQKKNATEPSPTEAAKKAATTGVLLVIREDGDGGSPGASKAALLVKGEGAGGNREGEGGGSRGEFEDIFVDEDEGAGGGNGEGEQGGGEGGSGEGGIRDGGGLTRGGRASGGGALACGAGLACG